MGTHLLRVSPSLVRPNTRIENRIRPSNLVDASNLSLDVGPRLLFIALVGWNLAILKVWIPLATVLRHNLFRSLHGLNNRVGSTTGTILVPISVWALLRRRTWMGWRISHGNRRSKRHQPSKTTKTS